VVDLLRAVEKKELLAQDSGVVRARARKLTHAGRRALGGGVTKVIFSVVACGKCNRLSVAVNGQALTRHTCGSAWKELAWEFVDRQLAHTALMLKPGETPELRRRRH
jgi:hypothetical protein